MKNVLSFVISVAALGLGPQAVAVERPNVLFVVADDLRTNLGCYGDPAAITPNMDRLAKRGVLFERAYCQQTVCNPSRASLLTGRRPDSIRVWSLGTHFREGSPDVITLPQYFKEHGYFTQGIGKVFHANRTKIQGDPESWSVPQKFHWHEPGIKEADVGNRPMPPNLASLDGTEIRDVPDSAYVDGQVADEAVRTLRTMPTRKEPFFLAVGFRKPHRPYNAPKKYWDLYRAKEMPSPLNPDGPLGAPTLATISAETDFLAAARRSPEAAAELRRGYYAATSYADAQLGRVIDELDRLGLAEKTIIVFFSDQGFNLGDHGIWGKTTCFEIDARVPLIIALPDRKQAGSRCRALSELLDLYPTLVEACGLPPAAGTEGMSLLPVLRNPQIAAKGAAFTQHPRPWDMVPEGKSNVSDVMGYSIRTDHYRYTEWRDWRTGATLAVELYDHRANDAEDVNLAGSLGALAAQRDLRARLAGQFPPVGIKP